MPRGTDVCLSLNQSNAQLGGKWSKGMAIDFGQTFLSCLSCVVIVQNCPVKARFQ